MVQFDISWVSTNKERNINNEIKIQMVCKGFLFLKIIQFPSIFKINWQFSRLIVLSINRSEIDEIFD